MFFYKIEGNPFTADMHYMHKAMAPIGYPATKADIIAKIGDKQIRVGHDAYKSVKDLVSPLKKESYGCACEFYSALFAHLYKE